METLEGHCAGDFHDLRMEVGGEVHHARSEEGATLILADGQTVDLNLEEAALIQNIDREAPFGELIDHEWAIEFLEHAPGDHVSARIHGFYVEAGGAIAVRGVPAYASTVGDDYRGSGARVESLLVKALAAGEDAVAALNRPRPRPARPRSVHPREVPLGVTERATGPEPGPISLRLPLGLVFLGGAALLAGIVLAFLNGDEAGGQAIAAGMLGIQICASGVLFVRRRRYLPDLRSRAEDLKGSGKRTNLGMKYALLLGLAFVFAVIVASTLSPQSPYGTLTLIVLIALVATPALVAMVSLALRERRSFGRLRELARPPAGPELNGWCAMDGRVVGGGYERRREHELHRESYVDGDGRTRRQVRYEYEDSVKGDTLEVALEGGGRLEVALGGALVASTRVIEHGDELIERIEIGDAVRVVGRPSREGADWRVDSTGEASLLVLGAPVGSAASAIRRALATHVLAVTLLGLAAAAATTLGLLAL